MGNLTFTDDLKDYIRRGIDKDPRFLTTPYVCDAYKSNLVRAPKITVYVMNDAEMPAYNTFDGEAASSYSVQVTCFVEQAEFDGRTLSAQDYAKALSAKIKSLFKKDKISSEIPSVIWSRRVGRSGALPLDSGERMYMAPLRYDIVVADKYYEEKEN